LQRVAEIARDLREPFDAMLVQKPKARVLILARDPVIAALIGMLLEMDGYDPVFPAPGEAAEKALGRLRAPLIICADCELPEVQSDLFFARVSKSNARLVLFGAPGSEENLKLLAARRSLPYFVLPTDRATLARVLDDALNDPEPRRGRDR
jgi:DNA-binding response OmpR family regulator